MAAEGEVPVYDVLNEAMEYLCKLGSNLRVRSETLKNKKIRREKLRNSHAVQKAANKVLLICELSKKSLQNVETGVKKVLSLVEQAQRSSGGSLMSSPRKNYEYFEYESKRLRIAKKVPLKHYMSMKVLARSMPSALLDKYPVYYDCKLYRLRKKVNILERQTDEETVIRSENNIAPARVIESHSEIDMECVTKEEEGKKSDIDCEKISKNVEVKNKSRDRLDENESDQFEKKQEKPEETENISIKCESDHATSREVYSKKKKNVLSDDESSHFSDRKRKNIPCDEDSHKSDRKKRVTSDNESIHECPRKKSEEISERRRSSGSHKKKKRIKHNSSSEDESQKPKSNKIQHLDEKNSDDDESKKDKHESKKRKKVKVFDDSSSEDESLNSKTKSRTRIKLESDNDGQEDELDTKSNLEMSDVNDKENHQDETKKEVDRSKPIKPLIKCVNLSKLLKPSLIHKVVQKKLDEQKNSSKKNQRTGMTEEESRIDRNKKALEKKSAMIKLDEEYWEEKRKEVKAFKAKNFVIKVTRLPKVTEHFLVKYNLNKITQSGSVVCEKLKSPLEKLANEMIVDGGVDSDGLDKMKTNECNINKVKKALLYDSDSDDMEPKKNDVTKEADKVKNALLQESDSDKNENSPIKAHDDYQSTDKEKQSRLSSPIENIEEVAQKTKNALLSSSDSENAAVGESIKDINERSPGNSPVHNNKEQDDTVNDVQQRSENEEEKEQESDNNEGKEQDPANNDKTDPDSSDQDPTSNEKTDQDSANDDKTDQNPSNTDKNEQDPGNDDNTGQDPPNNDKSDQNLSNTDKNEQDPHNDDKTEQDTSNDEKIKKDKSVEKEVEQSNQNENYKSSNENERNHSQNEKSVELTETTKNPDEVKSALLNSSDDNNHKTPSAKKRRDSHGTTPRSKRKYIMESMHAKKMLLTYSSSSETEDEQLRSVLKEIKDELLKGNSSDEEKRVRRENMRHRRKLVMTSDSEDDSKKLKETSKSASTDKKSDDEKSDKSGSNSITKDHGAEDSDKSNSKSESITRKNDLAAEDSDKSNSRSESITKSKDFVAEDSDKSNSRSESITRTKDFAAQESDKSKSSRSKIGRTKTNSSSSGSSKSDSLDSDKDINGLTNLRSLNKIRRRRGSTSTASKSSRSLGCRRRMPKSPLISAENMLQAESSSDGGSGAESEAGEDLPSVTLSVAPINGGLGDMTKEELLGESDSSSSKNDSDGKDSDAKVKSKRRKAHAISSDSEAGSSRRKDVTVKLSDFEDSEEESSEPAKKSKRKKIVDSDASAGSSDDGKKKRRRIKQLDSEGSGSDTENEGRNKHGRKNIRKVMGKNQLEEATKKAAREEKERIARIAERQKLYNNLEFDESGKPDEVVLEKVVLDFDPDTKEPLIEVDRGLVKKLKPHQANGIKFMWDACFESVKRIKKDKGSGCILAHCMGLGKTLQVVSLTHTLLTHGDLTGVNRVLVVCPLSTVLNWVNEFKMWLKHAETEFEVDVYELSRYKQNSERAFQLQQWFEHGGVCVLGYEMFRNLSADNAKKFKKKMLRNFQESLVDPGPDLVVCDEGHLLKNEKTSLSQSMNRVKTLRRIVLTGTPLQNNLKEYYCMVQFVKPNLLGKYNEYLNRFVNPITNGQYTDSTEHDIRVMKRRSHVLHKMLDGAVQRRDYGVLAPFLPPKHEYVLFITLTELQIKLYQHYLDNYSRRPLPGKSSGFLFPDFQSLQRIWTHPLVLKYNSERYEIMQQKKREREEEEDSEGSLADFIDDDSTPDESSTEESSDDSSGLSDDSQKKNKKKKSPKKSKAKDSKASTRRGTRANPGNSVEMEEEDKNDVLEVKHENPTEWWIKLITEEELDDIRNSSKLLLLFEILRQCEAIGDKLLVFSQSLYSLDLIEHFLGKVDEATQEGRVDEKLAGHVGSWSPGIDYFRLDGSTSCENRSIWCKNFNREDNPRARLFLISTRAGGLGINLVAANRVVIFDVSWNPSHDVQSIFRVYRFGQKKPCYVYRFLAMGTMEEKIYERQVTKQAISKRVIDEQQIDRHYAENDLAELYKFEAHPPTPRPIPPLPKDRLFAEMLREHEAQIYKYHEHDSLLENKEEETLSEEERKAAWEDFENEKNRPPPAPAPMAWPGMVPGLLQQQQLAYAALAAMLRKDMPNINDQQIRDMLPLIYNANPGMFGGYDYGLMQKMGEIYKYAQPGMMNPGMMNPLMAGAGGGGMGGGTSGLQYEPPWQRQQQQQQQMRLQQILQQQQNQQMGAKYYAGGLGSRDPVAMALQQQRAREIMVGGERGRPRGRPPLQPRPAPRQAPGDVVNLDSD